MGLGADHQVPNLVALFLLFLRSELTVMARSDHQFKTLKARVSQTKNSLL